MKKYGLRHKESQKLLVISILSHTDDEAPIEASYSLELGSDNDADQTWLVSTKEQADFARRNPQEMIVSKFVAPEHEFKASELEVVEFVISTQPVEVTPYTYENFIADLKKEYADQGVNDDVQLDRLLKNFLKEKEAQGGETDSLLKKWSISHFQTPFDENKQVLAKYNKAK